MTTIPPLLDNGKLNEYITLCEFAAKENSTPTRVLESGRYNSLPFRFHPNINRSLAFIVRDTAIPTTIDEQLYNLYEYTNAMTYTTNSYSTPHPLAREEHYQDVFAMFHFLLDEHGLDTNKLQHICLDTLAECTFELTPDGLQLLTHKGENLCTASIQTHGDTTTISAQSTIILSDYASNIILYTDELALHMFESSDEFTRLCQAFQDSNEYKKHGIQIQQGILEVWITTQGYKRDKARELKVKISKHFGITTLQSRH